MNDIEAIVDDLTHIADQARWAHIHGYWKAGHGLAAEHGTDLSRPETDRLKGPVYDLEIGDHKARKAYQHACRAVTRTDLLLVHCLQTQGIIHQPALHPLADHAHCHELANTATRAIWRARQITDEKPHRHRLNIIRRTLDRTVKALSRALDHGQADGIAHNETPCKTCRVRPQAERERPDGTKRPAQAGECDTCATWRRRNGKPRPVSLDQDSVNQARAAQARRLARGEGWGAA